MTKLEDYQASSSSAIIPPGFCEKISLAIKVIIWKEKMRKNLIDLKFNENTEGICDKEVSPMVSHLLN